MVTLSLQALICHYSFFPDYPTKMGHVQRVVVVVVVVVWSHLGYCYAALLSQLLFGLFTGVRVTKM